MRISRKICIHAITFVTLFFIILFAQPNNTFAATTSKKLDEITILQENTVYKFDLNGDGKTETLQYKLTVNEEQYKTTLRLYINKKLYLTKEDDGLTFNISILDINQSDSSLDLYIHNVMASDSIKNAFIAQYDGRNLKTIAFEPNKLTKDLNIYRYSLASTDGKGNFTLAIDTPVYSTSIGCFYSLVSFQLKDNKITMPPTRTFTLSNYSKTYQYKVAKAFSAYRTAGSKTAVYKVKKGDTVTFDRMYLSKTGKVYFRMNNSKGKRGWVRADLENLFYEIPLWG